MKACQYCGGQGAVNVDHVANYRVVSDLKNYCEYCAGTGYEDFINIILLNEEYKSPSWLDAKVDIKKLEVKMKKKYKVACVSNIGGYVNSISVPPADILLVSGSLTRHGNQQEFFQFFSWAADQPVKKCYFMGGPLDMGLYTLPGIFKPFIEEANKELAESHAFKNSNPEDNEENKKRLESLKDLVLEKFIYVEEELVEHEDLKIYGTPYSNKAGEFAFTVLGDPYLEVYWNKIPVETNVLMTNEVPRNILDKNEDHYNTGSYGLEHRLGSLPNLVLHTFNKENTEESFHSVVEDNGITYVNSGHKDKIGKNSPQATAIVVEIEV